MNNIQKFDELVAMLLAHLYENFPRRTEIDAFEFLGINYEHHSFLEDNEGYEEYANKCQEVDFLLDTALWLIDSGFLYGKIENEVAGFYTSKKCIDITLSPKGLELLKLVPNSLEVSQNLGDKLVDTINQGAKDAGSKLVSEALTKFGSVNQLMNLFGNLGG
ncbi:hypothetical protein AAFX30_08730 [Vibrio chagasii]|uniref:hypothetical protein n=1 Tax=Vibrio chagasii TaxID=170679 RepID=UPI0038CD3875